MYVVYNRNLQSLMSMMIINEIIIELMNNYFFLFCCFRIKEEYLNIIHKFWYGDSSFDRQTYGEC